LTYSQISVIQRSFYGKLAVCTRTQENNYTSLTWLEQCMKLKIGFQTNI
jgi:hypothetical protein